MPQSHSHLATIIAFNHALQAAIQKDIEHLDSLAQGNFFKKLKESLKACQLAATEDTLHQPGAPNRFLKLVVHLPLDKHANAVRKQWLTDHPNAQGGYTLQQPDGYHDTAKTTRSAWFWLESTLSFIYSTFYGARTTLSALSSWFGKQIPLVTTLLSIGGIAIVGLRLLIQLVLLLKNIEYFKTHGQLRIKCLELIMTCISLLALIGFLTLSNPLLLFLVCILSTVMSLSLIFATNALKLEITEHRGFFISLGKAILNLMRPKDAHNPEQVWTTALFWASITVSTLFIVSASLSLIGIAFLGPIAMACSFVLGLVILGYNLYKHFHPQKNLTSNNNLVTDMPRASDDILHDEHAHNHKHTHDYANHLPGLGHDPTAKAPKRLKRRPARRMHGKNHDPNQRH